MTCQTGPQQTPTIDLAVFDGTELVEAHRYDRVADAARLADHAPEARRLVLPLSPAAQAAWIHRHRRSTAA